MECIKNKRVSSVQPVKSVVNTDTCLPRRSSACGTKTGLLTPASCSILLIAVNARYSHSSYSVRTLKANLGELEDKCSIYEAELCVTPLQLAACIAENSPEVVGFSIYLWNLRIIEATADILKKIAPEIKLIAGGPELTEDYENTSLFDLCIIGEGESVFREYCRDTLGRNKPTAQQELRPPAFHFQKQINGSHIIKASPEDTNNLKRPFHLYSDEDIANRVIYLEASRGCPYHCTYCTSAGTGLRLIPLETLLPRLDDLWQRGTRRFKFLDRSFTAAKDHALTIMDFFLERYETKMCLHFEVYTDNLHDDIKNMIKRFPAGTLHLECGVQTLNPVVAKQIGRSPNVDTTLANLKFLVEKTGADVHADLIFGLPGEDESSFASGFNKLLKSCNPPAIQVNLLKALPGTELSRKADFYKLKFNSEPPYELLESDCMDFRTLNRIQRFARCWELIHNRKRLQNEANALQNISQDVYGTFMQLSGHIYKAEGRMHRITQNRLKELIDEF